MGVICTAVVFPSLQEAKQRQLATIDASRGSNVGIGSVGQYSDIIDSVARGLRHTCIHVVMYACHVT